MNAYIIAMDAAAVLLLSTVAVGLAIAARRARQARLTAREREVLDLICKGVINDHEIARALHVAPATAATHVQRILHKTRLHNRRELMLLPPPGSASTSA